ncbi:hypothetical protein MHTCC0001_19210 [Flavobacteriaceae bacterium MHTCC 0001]
MGQLASPLAPLTTNVDPTCTVATGSITVTNPVGTSTYTLTGIAPVVASQTGISFTGLASGTYELTETNAAGCISPATSITIGIGGIADPTEDCDMDGNPNGTDPNPTAPTAAPDNGTGISGIVTTINILDNDDYLPNNDPNNEGTTTIVDAGTGSASGTIAFDPDTGELDYTPTAGEAGTTVTVDYTVCNSDTGVCSTETVTIVVASDTDMDGNPDATDPNPTAPTAAPDNGTGISGMVTTIDILDNDDYLPNNDPNNEGTTTIVDAGTGSAGGTIAFDPDTGELDYTPTAGEAGMTVTVDYTVCNSYTGVCSTETVTIVVDELITLEDDTATTEENIPIDIDVFDNDSDIPSEGTIAVTPPTNGTVVITDPNNTPNDPSDDIITYTPDTNFRGTDTFTYTICDTEITPNCETAIVEITVESPCAFVFNEFSPNNDGDNDFLVITCIEDYPNNVLEIYNRWGNIVYKKRGYNNEFKGISNGRAVINEPDELPVGTYYYVLDLGNGDKPKVGWLYLNR